MSQVDRSAVHVCLALLPLLGMRFYLEGSDLGLQRLAVLAGAFGVTYLWSALFARRPWPGFVFPQLQFAMLFALMDYEPVSWGQGLLAVSFGWVFAQEMFGGKPVISPVLVAMAFGIFSFPLGGFEEEWITNALPVYEMGYAAIPGALWLLWRREISILVIAGAVAGIGAAVTLYPPTIPWWEHIFVGMLVIGVVFIGADKRFVPESYVAQAFYGVFIGAMIVTIRIGDPDAPDGVAFALLIGALFAPLLARLVGWRPKHA